MVDIFLFYSLSHQGINEDDEKDDDGDELHEDDEFQEDNIDNDEF
jgi:hypothetical protein